METVVENVTSRSAPCFSNSAAAFLMACTVAAALSYQEANRTARSVRLKHLSQPIETDTIRLRLAKGRRPPSAFAQPAQVSTPQPRSPQARERMCAASFNHLIRAGEERGRDREGERTCGFQVDEELKFNGLLDRQITGLRAFQNLIDVGCGATKHIS
jgi:hypothetical protein